MNRALFITGVFGASGHVVIVIHTPKINKVQAPMNSFIVRVWRFGIWFSVAGLTLQTNGVIPEIGLQPFRLLFVTLLFPNGVVRSFS